MASVTGTLVTQNVAFWKARNEKLQHEQLEVGSAPGIKKMDWRRPGMKGFLDISRIQLMVRKAEHIEAQASRTYFYPRKRNKTQWHWVQMSAAG